MTGFVEVTESQIAKRRTVRLQCIRHDQRRAYALILYPFAHELQGGQLVLVALSD